MEKNSLTQKIIGESIYVLKELGAWLLENAYQKCHFHGLNSFGLSIE